MLDHEGRLHRALPRIYRASRSYLACVLPLVRSARPTRSRRFTGLRQLGMPQSRDEPSRDRSAGAVAASTGAQRISLRDAQSSRYTYHRDVELIREKSLTTPKANDKALRETCGCPLGRDYASLYQSSTLCSGRGA